MKCNVGGLDRPERIFHGLVFLFIAFFLVQGVWQYIFGIYGFIRLITGVFAFCPVYVPLNMSTRKKRD